MIETTDTAVRRRSIYSRPLRDHVEALEERFGGLGMTARDIRGAGALELTIGKVSDGDDRETGRPVVLERLEGSIAACDVAVAAPGTSRFRAFLDGSQRTLPIWRFGLVPIVYGIAAVGVLDRSPQGAPSLHPETLRLQSSWIFPTGTNDADLRQLHMLLDANRVLVIDSLDGELDDVSGLRIIGQYANLIEKARSAAQRQRQDLETDALDYWSNAVAPHRPDDWLVVDGPLRRNVPRTVGLVKELLTQHLDGPEALALFDLQPGQRTTAFRIVSSTADADGRERSAARTMWYMRFWDARGKDARHSLVRVEVAHEIHSTAAIDEISGWLLAERLPRATADARWPTLLYPIHLLEAMLRRRLASVTVGWPT